MVIQYDKKGTPFPVGRTLLSLLRLEEREYRYQEFPDDHRYHQALTVIVTSGYLDIKLEALLARHCFYVCARLIDIAGSSAAEHPVYQHYQRLLDQLPTDWFDDNQTFLLQELFYWH